MGKGEEESAYIVYIVLMYDLFTFLAFDLFFSPTTEIDCTATVTDFDFTALFESLAHSSPVSFPINHNNKLIDGRLVPED